MSKHYPNGISLEEMENVQTGDTIQSETRGLVTVIEPHYGELHQGDHRGPVIQRCALVKAQDGERYMLMISKKEKTDKLG